MKVGHFLVAKLCNVKVNEFSIGFGPLILKKKKKETEYSLRLIPLGGYVRMEGEDEESTDESAFPKASIPKGIAIVCAGAFVNIVFGLIIYMSMFGIGQTGNLLLALGDSIKQLFTGKVGIDNMVGPVGIGGIISQTQGFGNYMVLLSVISISLGVTNLLPIPALDGGRLVLILIEAIRGKPMKQETEIYIQLLGFSLLITLSVIVMYQDIVRIIG